MLSEVERREIRKRYESGETYRDLSRELSMSHNTIREALVVTGGRSRPSRVPFFGLDLRLARRLARRVSARSLTVRDFATQMDVSVPTATKLIRFVGGKCPRG